MLFAQILAFHDKQQCMQQRIIPRRREIKPAKHSLWREQNYVFRTKATKKGGLTLCRQETGNKKTYS